MIRFCVKTCFIASIILFFLYAKRAGVVSFDSKDSRDSILSSCHGHASFPSGMTDRQDVLGPYLWVGGFDPETKSRS